MKRRKRRQSISPLDELFDDQDPTPSYSYPDDDAERLIAKMEKNIEPEEYEDFSWRLYT